MLFVVMDQDSCIAERNNGDVQVFDTRVKAMAYIRLCKTHPAAAVHTKELVIVERQMNASNVPWFSELMEKFASSTASLNECRQMLSAAVKKHADLEAEVKEILRLA
jgi:hypothetical protein